MQHKQIQTRREESTAEEFGDKLWFSWMRIRRKQLNKEMSSSCLQIDVESSSFRDIKEGLIVGGRANLSTPFTSLLRGNFAGFLSPNLLSAPLEKSPI